MNTTSQQYMATLAQEGSITAAARRLGVSQSGLCSWLDSLEEQLGIKLVLRSRKGVILTPAGQLYLNGSRRMLAVQQRTITALASLRNRERPFLKVAGTPGGGAQVFAQIFGAFTNRFPSVQLQFIESYNRKALQLVEEGTADFALCSLPDPDVCQSTCLVKRRTELVVFLPNQYPMGYDASRVYAGRDALYDARRGNVLLSSFAAALSMCRCLPKSDFSEFQHRDTLSDGMPRLWSRDPSQKNVFSNRSCISIFSTS